MSRTAGAVSFPGPATTPRAPAMLDAVLKYRGPVTDSLEPPPKPSAAERASEVLRASAGEIPIAGTVVAALVQVFGTSYQQRQDEWTRRLWEVVSSLQTRGIDLDGLTQREEWVTAVHDASRIALGEHLAAKLDMLQAVLLNAATRPPDPIADLWTLRYMRWIDELEPIHVELLAFGVDPRVWLEEHGKQTPEFMSGGRRHVFDLAEWSYPPDVIDLALDDLARLQLGSPGTGMVTGGAMYNPWISERGRRFLDWLTFV